MARISRVTALFAAAVLCFLILLVFDQQGWIAVWRAASTRNEEARWSAAATLVGSRIDPEGVVDPLDLERLAASSGFLRLLLVGPDGRVSADSLGAIPPGGRSNLAAPPPTASPSWVAMTDSAGRRVKIGSLDLGGGTSVQLIAPAAGPPAPGLLRLLVWVFGMVTVGVLGYQGMRLLRQERRMPEPAKESETGFVIATFQDLLRKLKEKEQELERLKALAEGHAADVETYNDNILRSVVNAVITLDHDGKVTTFNQAAERLFEFPRQAAIGRIGPELFAQEPALFAFIEAEPDPQAGAAPRAREIELQRGGETLWISATSSLLRDRSDSVIGRTFVFTDMTRLKRLEEQVERDRRMSALGEMSAWIAHEFRNYMQTITGWARILSKKMDPEDPRRTMVQAVMDEVAAMDHLISDLLAFGRKPDLRIGPVDLHALVISIFKQVRAAGQYSDVSLEVLIGDGVGPFQGDAGLLRQALSNLITNALESLDGCPKREVRVWARVEGNTGNELKGGPAIRVMDTGRGVPRENFEKIFLPFFTTKERGTGLGLPLVYKIVTAHGGKVEVESQEGSGTTFIITLPLSPAAVEEGASGVAGAAGSER